MSVKPPVYEGMAMNCPCGHTSPIDDVASEPDRFLCRSCGLVWVRRCEVRPRWAGDHGLRVSVEALPQREMAFSGRRVS